MVLIKWKKKTINLNTDKKEPALVVDLQILTILLILLYLNSKTLSGITRIAGGNV